MQFLDDMTQATTDFIMKNTSRFGRVLLVAAFVAVLLAGCSLTVGRRYREQSVRLRTNADQMED